MSKYGRITSTTQQHIINCSWRSLKTISLRTQCWGTDIIKNEIKIFFWRIKCQRRLQSFVLMLVILYSAVEPYKKWRSSRLQGKRQTNLLVFKFHRNFKLRRVRMLSVLMEQRRFRVDNKTELDYIFRRPILHQKHYLHKSAFSHLLQIVRIWQWVRDK